MVTRLLGSCKSLIFGYGTNFLLRFVTNCILPLYKSGITPLFLLYMLLMGKIYYWDLCALKKLPLSRIPQNNLRFWVS